MWGLVRPTCPFRCTRLAKCTGWSVVSIITHRTGRSRRGTETYHRAVDYQPDRLAGCKRVRVGVGLVRWYLCRSQSFDHVVSQLPHTLVETHPFLESRDVPGHRRSVSLKVLGRRRNRDSTHFATGPSLSSDLPRDRVDRQAPPKQSRLTRLSESPSGEGLLPL